jgi:hypothetical protein
MFRKEILRNPRSMSEIYVRCNPARSASCSCDTPNDFRELLIARPNRFFKSSGGIVGYVNLLRLLLRNSFVVFDGYRPVNINTHDKPAIFHETALKRFFSFGDKTAGLQPIPARKKRTRVALGRLLERQSSKDETVFGGKCGGAS